MRKRPVLTTRRSVSHLPTTCLTEGHVTALTTATSKSVDLSRLQVRTCSPLLLVHWLISVTCVKFPRPLCASRSGVALIKRYIIIMPFKRTEFLYIRYISFLPGQGQIQKIHKEGTEETDDAVLYHSGSICD